MVSHPSGWRRALSWRPWASWSTAYSDRGRVIGRRVHLRVCLDAGMLWPRGADGALAVGGEVVLHSGVFMALADGDGAPDVGETGGIVFEHSSGTTGEWLLSRSPKVPTVLVPKQRGGPNGARMPRLRVAGARMRAIGAFFVPADGRVVGSTKLRDVSWLVNRIDCTEGCGPTLRQLASVAVAKGALPRRLTKGCADGLDPLELQLHVTTSDLTEMTFADASETVAIS